MDKNVQYILEVAKCGGITKAANNLYITPSALSKFVQAREEELNVQLFHRIGKHFVLTAAGEYYVGRCKEIETIQKEITIQMERFSSMSHGMIRIGVQPSFSDLVLKDIIPKFQESFPAVKIILQEYSTGELMELLKKQQVDVVLATIDQKDADLEYRPVKMCEFVMAVGKNHHLAKAISDVSWYELTRQLEYKAKWNGRKYIKIDTFYASSQLCSVCGYQNPDTKDLSVMTWICPKCGAEHDRDINAAKNILTEGLRQIA